jgi:hypothetical protein
MSFLAHIYECSIAIEPFVFMKRRHLMGFLFKHLHQVFVRILKLVKHLFIHETTTFA